MLKIKIKECSGLAAMLSISVASAVLINYRLLNARSVDSPFSTSK
jgi:hypothetical protein